MISRQKLKRAALVVVGGAALWSALPLRAQNPPTEVPASPAPPGKATFTPRVPGDAAEKESDSVTFEDILAKARPGRVGLVLAVDAENETLSKEDFAKSNPDTVFRAAEAFHLMAQDFGGMTAIGPQTYTELANDFSRANAFADIPPMQAFTLLLASLDDGQRAALTSAAGLGLRDMKTTTQKQLFPTLLPDKEASLFRREKPADGSKSLGNLRENANAVHFRVAQEVTLQYEMKGQEYGRVDAPPAAVGAVLLYEQSTFAASNNLSKVNGVEMRREVPNRLKPSNLDYNAPSLQRTIAIKDLKTVGDLIARVAKQTGYELYCDPHYEKKRLTWLANGKEAASASEMLRAIAFSLAATYRKVGAAFVLTEDVTGAGTRRKIIQDFEEECDAMRQKAVADAERTLKENPAQQKMKISSFGDPLAMSAEQEKTHSTPAKAGDTSVMISEIMDFASSLGSATLSFDKLTPKQQEAAQNYEDSYKKRPPQAHPDSAAQNYAPNFDGKIHVLKRLAVQMIIDGVDGPVAADFGPELTSLFRAPLKVEDFAAASLAMFANLPKWTETAKTYPRRAVICRPHTTEDVDSVLARIAALGFNQMWLVVFEDGKARISGTPFPLDPACDPKVDILTYAIAAGAKKGIIVCPLVSAYSWGTSTPAELRLLTLRGEDSAQSAVRRFHVNSLKPESPLAQYQPKPKNDGPSPAVFVDPTNPAVQAALTGLFKTLAAHAGAGDWICREATPVGFAGQDMEIFVPFGGKGYDSMGYNPALRLAFLRKNHFDPIDSKGMNFLQNVNRANTNLTGFNENDGAAYGEAQKWNLFRAEAHDAALRSLFAAVWDGQKDSAKRPTIVFAQDVMADVLSYFDLWSDPKSPLPNPNIFGGADGKPLAPPASQASMFLLPTEPENLPKEWAAYDWRSVQLKTMEMYKAYRTWQGIVIEE